MGLKEVDVDLEIGERISEEGLGVNKQEEVVLVSLECSVSDVEKEEHKRVSNKKGSRPPRAPRGPSLDAADQKLIREIIEVAMLKRGRMNAKKMKASKVVVASSSFGTNIFAIIFTLVFCLLIISQGF